MQTEKNMAGPYEIIVLDLDGTLTNRDKVVTPRTKAALMKAQERGKKVVLASGRVDAISISILAIDTSINS